MTGRRRFVRMPFSFTRRVTSKSSKYFEYFASKPPRVVQGAHRNNKGTSGHHIDFGHVIEATSRPGERCEDGELRPVNQRTEDSSGYLDRSPDPVLHEAGGKIGEQFVTKLGRVTICRCPCDGCGASSNLPCCRPYIGCANQDV